MCYAPGMAEVRDIVVSGRFVILAAVVVNVMLLAARVLEVETGHIPTQELTLAFQASLTATLGLLGWYAHAR